MLVGADPERDRIRALPKPELHVHLDGSLRAATLLELANERGVPLPAGDEAGLRERLVASKAGSLEEYLRAFDITLSVMQDAAALERIAFELGEDHAREDVLYAEVRFCPLLNTRGGLTPEQVLDAALKGIRRADAQYGTRSAVIVCALRHLPPETSIALAELAVRYREHGVCGFDLAGAEAGNPVRNHAEAFSIAHAHGIPVTVHAGEAFGPASIRQALELGHATRIGHGTHLGDDPDLLDHVRDAGVTLEVCLTSNVQTGAAASYETHPLRRYFDAGVSVTLGTDNRLVSGVSLTDEYLHAREALGFGWDELVEIARNGFRRAFAPPELRAALVGRLDERAARLA